MLLNAMYLRKIEHNTHLFIEMNCATTRDTAYISPDA